MCGIAGFIGYEDASGYCEFANQIQTSWADSQDIWLERGRVMHQRLSIDLTDAGSQPFVKRNLVLVFNGEIELY